MCISYNDSICDVNKKAARKTQCLWAMWRKLPEYSPEIGETVDKPVDCVDEAYVWGFVFIDKYMLCK